MRSATSSVRGRDVTAATRAIQSALKFTNSFSLVVNQAQVAPIPSSPKVHAGTVDAFTILDADSNALDTWRPTAPSGQRPRRKLADVVRFLRQLDLAPLRQAGLL